VRIGDLGQGTNPIRITSIRSLPDAGLSEVMHDLDAADRELIQGDHVNLEVSFAYRANPATSRKASRAVNAQ
jgi:Ca2+-dependent lipid-binding protein